MRTTLDLPKPLLEEAMRLSNHNTRTAVIIAALEDYVRKNTIQGLKEFKGKVDLEIDLSRLRDRS